MKKKLFFMAITVMMLLSCSTGNHEKIKAGTATTDQISKDLDKTKELSFTPPQIVSDNEVGMPIKDPQSYKDWDKKIIKTAEVNISVPNYSDYDHKIHNGLKPYGAYISNEEQRLDNSRKTNSITIKVPVDKFDALLSSFSGDSVIINQKKINSEEVTGEMLDTQTRIQAKKQMRERYLELLKQAKNMKEILEVQKEINDIQESIESIDGRLNYLQHQTSYSTIQLEYAQYVTPVDIPKGKLAFYFSELSNAFRTGINIIVGISVFVVSVWPLVIIGLGVFLFWKRKRIIFSK